VSSHSTRNASTHHTAPSTSQSTRRVWRAAGLSRHYRTWPR
jgi:hypothetical protein